MKLSTRARYGLRAMVAVTRAQGERATGERLAAEEDVSKKYLDAILGALRKAGLLRAHRGAAGGYTLARPPERISAADVVEALEGEMSLVPCTADASYCERAEHCAAREVWRSVSAAVRGALGARTLADLTGAPAASGGCRTGRKAEA